MKQSIKSVLVLVCICAVVSVALALTNYITAPIIASNAAGKADEALLEVYPDGGTFEKIDISDKNLPTTVVDAYSASNGGFVFRLVTKGYAQGMTIMCGIDANGVITGAKYLSGGETNGGEVTMSGRVPGATIDTIDQVDTSTSPTAPLTVNGYMGAIKDALNAAVVLSGGKTEAEILQENLETALPSADGQFTKYFFVEVVDGIDAIYLAENNSGAVCVIGETFIGVDANGQVLTQCDAEAAQKASDAVLLVLSTTTTDIDLSLYTDAGLSNRVVSAKVTATGNYILTVKGAGFGINGDDEYYPSGQYIMIQVSLTADGRVIDCLTVSHKETVGLGAACEDEAFYGQFDGKTEEDYMNIDGISGATLTTDGYKRAILNAFNAVKIFEGGNE